MVGDGNLTSFWEAPWLEGQKPKDIAPQIFMLSKTKKWCIKKVMDDNAWISKITLNEEFSHAHLAQFVELWVLLLGVLVENMEDKITWMLTPNGKYSAASAYKAQFFGAEASIMKSHIWKACSPGKALDIGPFG